MNANDEQKTTATKCSPTMDSSDSLTYRLATTADCDALATLINSSYRGPLSYQGWTNEDTLVPVSRTSADNLSKMISTDGYIFLVFFGGDDQVLTGCLSLLHKPKSKAVKISLFAVRPDLQARGYGKFILSTAEQYAVNNWNVEWIELTAIEQRPELISFYSRRGFVDMGDRHPFVPPLLNPVCTMRDDLTICTMRKYLK